MLTNRTSRWSIGVALLCVVLLAASWFLLISPKRAEAVEVRSQATAADTQVDQLQIEIAELKAQFADLPKRLAELEAIKKELPPKADIPALLRSLQQIATDAGVDLDSITPGAPTVLAPSAAGGAAPAAPAAGPVAAGSVVAVPVALSVTGDYFEASLFVKKLQTKIGRAYLLTGITVGSAPAEEVPVAPTVEPTPLPMPTPSSSDPAAPVPVPVPVPVVVPTATAPPPDPLKRVTLTLTGSIYVLMDGTTTVADVAKDVPSGSGTPAATAAATSAAAAN